jgi:hypothetical protein
MCTKTWQLLKSMVFCEAWWEKWLANRQRHNRWASKKKFSFVAPGNRQVAAVEKFMSRLRLCPNCCARCYIYGRRKLRCLTVTFDSRVWCRIFCDDMWSTFGKYFKNCAGTFTMHVFGKVKTVSYLGEMRGPTLFWNMHGWDPILMYYLLQIIGNWYFVLFRCEHREVLCA